MENLTFYQEEALRIIALHTQNNPITGVAVAKRINLKDRDSGKEGADIREVINALRCKGYPICANSMGYFYARLKPELQTFIESFKGRIDKQTEAYNGMLHGFDRLDTEFELPEDMVVVPERSGSSGHISEAMKNKTSWTFESRTRKGVKYTVSDFTSYLFCDCPAYNYKKRCRHTEQVKDMIAQKVEIKQVEPEQGELRLF